jgi:hypothetical protein
MEVGAQACSLRGEMVARGKFGPAEANALSNGGVACGAVGAGGGPGWRHMARRWRWVPARPAGDGRSATTRPRCSWAAHVRVAPNQGEARAERWAPATVPGGTRSNSLNCFQNSNGSKTFKLFQILTAPNLTFYSFKNLK